MAGQVRLDDPAALRTFAAEVRQVAQELQYIKVYPAITPKLASTGPRGAPPGVAEAIAEFTEAAESRVQNAIDYFFPAMDDEQGRQLTALVQRATSAVPAPPDPPR